MSSSSVTLKSPWRLNSSSKLTRINPIYEDYSAEAISKEILQRKIETLIATITLEENKASKIERLFSLKTPLIQERSKILQNPIKLFLPSYKKKLKELDAELDRIELEIYKLETLDKNNGLDLNETLLQFEKRLEERTKIFSENIIHNANKL
ncbi:hypothetical protein DGG96_17435 [Legionella qingyii]|uniref:Uncharacterized protein n=1 Tax=Legionella qingyii TaxID=2184757 RepID=A0A317TXN4_9GAMM|nr:hypothetical protein [Legionella qingyii]PWY54323.1 hypothetical protein DGG96_17435 [Legionella qingyii]RUR24133.1 hypothetical protein ELY20_06115 [Legionella qingyii]